MIYTILNTVIFSVLSALHIYWAAGGKVGLVGAVPEIKNKAIFQTKGFIAGTLLVAAGLALCAVMHWQFVQGNSWFNGIGFAVLAILFLLRAIGDFNYVGFFKKKKNSLFAERDNKLYIPLCLLIAFNATMTFFL